MYISEFYYYLKIILKKLDVWVLHTISVALLKKFKQ